MSLAELESFDLNKYYYNMHDALWRHIVSRSEDCFQKAEKQRRAISTQKDLEEYVAKQREFFINALGGIPYDNSLPLNARVTGVIDEPGLRIEKIIFESRPKVYVTANLYIPEKRKKPCGAVLFQVGHAASGKSREQYQRVARIIASAGVIVMIMDPIGQGERLSYYEESAGQVMIPPCTGEHQYAGEQCVLIGDSIARYFIADAMRAVDYLISRPEVDESKIGATGSSGGGTATCHAMVCDERICAAAPGTFVTSRSAYLYTGGAQDSEQIWMGAGAAGFDHYELLACFAPKPLLVLTVDSDFFPIEGACEVVDACRPFWKLYDSEDKLDIFTDQSEHKYTDALAQAAAGFFAKELNGESRHAEMSMVRSLPEEALWCTETGLVKTSFPDARFVFDENLERYASLESEHIPIDEAGFIREKMKKGRKKEPLHLRTFAPMYENGLKIQAHMWFSQPNMPNCGLLFTKPGEKPQKIVICLWDEGTDDLRNHIYQIRKICNEGKGAFIVDLSAIGKCTPNSLNTGYNVNGRYGVQDRLAKDLFFLDDSLCALRLFELEYVIDIVEKKMCAEPELYVDGVSAAYGRLWNIISPQTAITHGEGCVTDYKAIVTERYYEDYNISGILLPGILRYLR